jgi:hypothetical protein
MNKNQTPDSQEPGVFIHRRPFSLYLPLILFGVYNLPALF